MDYLWLPATARASRARGRGGVCRREDPAVSFSWWRISVRGPPMARVTPSRPSTPPAASRASAPARPAPPVGTTPRSGVVARGDVPARARMPDGHLAREAAGPLPLALWPLGQPPATAGIPGEEKAPDPLWARVLESFSWPGDLVLDPRCSSPDFLVAAARRRRMVLGLAADEAAAARLGASCDAMLSASERRRVRLLAPVEAEEACRVITGTVDLVAVSLEPGSGRAAAAGSLPFAAWRSCLRAGGALVVASRAEVRRHALVDRAGEVVAAARAAGFTYLQHVVVLRAEIRDGDLVYEAPPPERAALRRSLARDKVRHVLVHEDLSVFVKPAHEKEAPRGR